MGTFSILFILKTNLLCKRIEPCHVHTCYQQVNVMCTLISNYRLQVHHVAHNAEFACYTHTTQHICLASRATGQCYIAAIAFSP